MRKQAGAPRVAPGCGQHSASRGREHHATAAMPRSLPLLHGNSPSSPLRGSSPRFEKQVSFEMWCNNLTYWLSLLKKKKLKETQRVRI